MIQIVHSHSLHFRLHVNDKRYHVSPPPRSQTSMEELDKLNDVRLLVAQVNIYTHSATVITTHNVNLLLKAAF